MREMLESIPDELKPLMLDELEAELSPGDEALQLLIQQQRLELAVMKDDSKPAPDKVKKKKAAPKKDVKTAAPRTDNKSTKPVLSTFTWNTVVPHHFFCLDDTMQMVHTAGGAVAVFHAREEAFEWLRVAQRLELELPYDEPWGWMTPVAHALGALLFEQGHVSEADEVFSADLKRWPKNLWSLLGKFQCAKGLNAPAAEVLDLEQQFREASQRMELTGDSGLEPCFCAGRVIVDSCCKLGGDR